MKIKSQEYNDVVVVELQGEFTCECVKQFEDTVSSIAASGHKGIVLDMTNVVFIDSVCLEQILWLRDSCLENNSMLKLAGLDENCAKILELTRLASQLDSYEELAGAVKSFV